MHHPSVLLQNCLDFFCLFFPSSELIRFIIYFCSQTSCYRQIVVTSGRKPLPFIFISDARFVNEASAASAAYFSFLSRQAELKSKKAAESFALCIEKYNRVGGEFEQKMSESSQVSSSHCGHARLQLCFSWLWPRPPDKYVIVILCIPHQKINKKETSTLMDPRCPPTRALLHIRRKAIQLNSLPPHFHGYCWRFYGNPRL